MDGTKATIQLAQEADMLGYLEVPLSEASREQIRNAIAAMITDKVNGGR